jgi:RNA polymerase sigma factor (sigma-70 family)
MNDFLLQEAKSGSASALNQLLIQSERYATSVVNGFLGNRYSAKIGVEDVVQEVLIKVATGVATCNAQTFQSYLGWLSFVARNETYKQIERIKAKKRTMDLGDGRLVDREAKGTESSPEQNIVAHETQQVLLTAASQLSPLTYEVARRLLEGMRPLEIAEDLGVRVTLVYRIVKSFKSVAVEHVQSGNRCRQIHKRQRSIARPHCLASKA